MPPPEASHPPPIQALKLRVTQGSNVFEQPISSSTRGPNNVPITSQTNHDLLNAFITQPLGTIFNASIVTTFAPGTFPSGDTLSIPSVSNFIPQQITPTISLASIPNKLTTDSPFSLSVTSPSNGLKTYSSSHPQFASIDSSTGIVTLVSGGTTTITVTMAASADGVYAAAGPVSTQLVVDKATPTLSIASISNKLTTASPFSVSELVTKSGTGVLAYESSHPQFASIDSSTGLVTPVSGGTTTITVTMAASADGVYAAAGPVSTQLVVDKAVPTLSIASILNKFTTDSPFYLSVTSPSSGLKTYSSSHPQFASIDSSTGLVTLVSSGTTTITVNMAASADGLYTAAGPVSTQLVVSRQSIQWIQLGSDIDGEAPLDQSGISVSLSSDGTTLAIGAVNNDANGDNSGHVRVYKYNPSKSVAQLNQSLPGFGPARWDRIGADIDGEALGDFHGRSVSLSSDGNILAIGATGNDGNGTDSGHVRVYNINSPTFGMFTLPSDIQVYQNQIITRVLTPPTSNSSGAFTFTSSNTAVATISVNNGVSSINIIGRGTTTIIASQAASGGYASSSVTASLNVIPMLSLADLPVKLTIDSPFSLSDFVTNNSTGVLSYESSDVDVANVNSSSGLVTIVGDGTITITISVAASGDGLYPAASVTKTLVVLLPITRAANGVTIQYPLTSIDSEPRFIQADPRNTESQEWFAVVTNASKAQITSYANSVDSAVSAYFTPSEESGPVPFKNIVTTLMTDMSDLFQNPSAFNQNIGSWDTAKVTTMSNMFSNATAFNNYGSEDIRYWNTAKVTDMSYMFSNATAFNQPIGEWNTSNVTDMGLMFMSATAFNQDIGSWNTAKVTSMYAMFANASAFNKPIGNWNTAKVAAMNSMFQDAIIFNQDLSGWNVALTTARPSLSRTAFATGSPLALAENSTKLPLFQ